MERQGRDLRLLKSKHIFSGSVTAPGGMTGTLVSRFVVILVSRGAAGRPTGGLDPTHAQRLRIRAPLQPHQRLRSTVLTLFSCCPAGADVYLVYILPGRPGSLGVCPVDFPRGPGAFFISGLILIDRCMGTRLSGGRWSLNIGFYLA